MKFLHKSALITALLIGSFSALVFAPVAVRAQFSDLSIAPTAQTGGPVAVGQAVAQVDPQGKVAIVQAPANDNAPKSGGVIQLAAFGWLQPYADTIAQALIVAFFGWLGKSKYSQWLDQSSRDALQTFAKNRASSLIANGAVSMRDKAVQVDNPLLYRMAEEATTAIPDALKRFHLTPDVIAAKIVAAIPQTEAGAAIISTAHNENDAPPVPVTDRPSSAPLPPTSADVA